MKRLRSLLLLTLIFSLLLTGCSASSKESMAYDSMGFYTTAADGKFDSAETESGALPGSGTDIKAENNPADLEEKLIYTAHITIETMDYDSAVSSIESYIREVGGFIESSDFSSDSGYDRYDGSRYTGARRAAITARIPRESYNGFLGKAPEWGAVQNQSSYVENITAQYNDVALQLESLEIQHESLLSMLEKASELDDMIRIEESLANVRWQINSIKSQLKNWDNEVSYSTVNINLNEVKQYTPTEKDSFFTRLSKAFKGGIEDYGEFLADLAVFATHALPFILTFAAVVIILIKPVKKHRAAVKAKKAAKADSEPEKTGDK